MAYFSSDYDESCQHLRNLALALSEVNPGRAAEIVFEGKRNDWSVQFRFEGWNITAILAGLSDRQRSHLEDLIEQNQNSLVPHAIEARRLLVEVRALQREVQGFVDQRKRAVTREKEGELREQGVPKIEAQRRAIRYAAKKDYAGVRQQAPQYDFLRQLSERLKQATDRAWPAFGGLSWDRYLDRARQAQHQPTPNLMQRAGPTRDMFG